MLEYFTFETAHLFGDSLPAMLRLRYDIFVQRQRYEVPSYQGMEFDEFDTPAARYLLWRAPDGRPGAVLRLIPTDQPYMIPRLWPELVAGDLPRSPDVWEVSRLGVDHRLPDDLRRAAMGALMLGLAELAELHRVARYLFVAHPGMIRRILQGIALIESMGPPQRMGKFLIGCYGVEVPTEARQLTAARYGEGPRIKFP